MLVVAARYQESLACPPTVVVTLELACMNRVGGKTGDFQTKTCRVRSRLRVLQGGGCIQYMGARKEPPLYK
jgi:hypothetical protein